jgi:hypothetical protein
VLKKLSSLLRCGVLIEFQVCFAIEVKVQKWTIIF